MLLLHGARLSGRIDAHGDPIPLAGQPRERWDELITTMQQKHGLWPLVPTIRAQLLDYLAATQPPSDPGLDAGKQTPWAQPLYRPNPVW